MNSHHLSRRLNQYGKSKIGLAREDKLVDPLEDVTLDEDYVPNPFIVSELIQESEPVFDYEVPTQMLNDGIEMLRRLDIIKASINYPVSGYRTSLSTLLKADPALESLNLSPTFTRRQLTTAIEGNKVDIIVSVLGLIVMLFGKQIGAALLKIKRRLYDKRHNIDPLQPYAKLSRAMSYSGTISWKGWGHIVERNTPIYYKSIEKRKKIVVRDYVKALFDEILKLNTHQVIDTMLTNQDKTAKLVEMANKLPVGVSLFLSDIDDAIMAMNTGYANGKLDSKEITKDLIEDNKNFIEEVREYSELAEVVLNTSNVTKQHTFEEFFPAAKKLIEVNKHLNVKAFLSHEKHINSIGAQLDKVQKTISNMNRINNPDLINEVQGVVVTLRHATTTVLSLINTVNNQYGFIDVFEKSIIDIEASLPAKFAN